MKHPCPKHSSKEAALELGKGQGSCSVLQLHDMEVLFLASKARKIWEVCACG